MDIVGHLMKLAVQVYMTEQQAKTKLDILEKNCVLGLYGLDSAHVCCTEVEALRRNFQGSNTYDENRGKEIDATYERYFGKERGEEK
jgi:hypothetical protein